MIRVSPWPSRYRGRSLAAILLAVLLSLPGPAPLAQASHGPAKGSQGLHGGWAVDDGGNVDFYHSLSSQYGTMHTAGAGWVRVNFRLGACFEDWARPGCNGKTAVQVYAEVVARAQANGLLVLGLLSNESWKGSQFQWTANNAETTRGSGDNAYVLGFAEQAAGVLADHFKGKIAQWEVWNEPNAWTYLDASGTPRGGTFVYPSNFAWLLKRSYERIKSSDPTATVISGGLFGHDIGGAAMMVQDDGVHRRVTKWGVLAGTSLARPAGTSLAPAAPAAPAGREQLPEMVERQAVTCSSKVPSGADYLCATYDMGIRRAGWKAGFYPLDYVGQHLYIDQGATTSSAKLTTYLADVRNAYGAYEGTGKQTHLTEFGWETRTGVLPPHVQAQNLETAFQTFKNTSYVGRAYWFMAQDIPEGNLYFGLVASGGENKCSPAAGAMKCTLEAYQKAATYTR